MILAIGGDPRDPKKDKTKTEEDEKQES